MAASTSPSATRSRATIQRSGALGFEGQRQVAELRREALDDVGRGAQRGRCVKAPPGSWIMTRGEKHLRQRRQGPYPGVSLTSWTRVSEMAMTGWTLMGLLGGFRILSPRKEHLIGSFGRFLTVFCAGILGCDDSSEGPDGVSELPTARRKVPMAYLSF